MNVTLVPAFVGLRVAELMEVRFPPMVRHPRFWFFMHSVISTSDSPFMPATSTDKWTVAPSVSLVLEVHSAFLIMLNHSGSLSIDPRGQISSGGFLISMVLSILARVSPHPFSF